MRSLRFLALALILAGSLSCRGSVGKPAQVKTQQLRIGFQKNSVLVLVKWRGLLEAALSSRGVTVQWAEFPSGPAVIEAINAGQLDLGNVGEAPPVFGQAASDALVYWAAEPPAPKAEAILVKNASAIHSVQELKGKTLALNKGSNVHYLLVQALKAAGLQYGDVKVVFLAPADARAAFESGSVDSWAIWDPYLASAETTLDARVLVDAEGLANNSFFYVARRELTERDEALSRLVVEQIAATDAWASGHLDETASYLAPLLGIDPKAMSLSVHRATWGARPIDEQILASQQRVADTFLSLGLLSKPLHVSDALPKTRVQW